MLGLGAMGLTAQNLQREKECVLNLSSVALVEAVNRSARLTASSPVPPHKLVMGYRHEADKPGAGELRACPSGLVKPPRIHECLISILLPSGSAFSISRYNLNCMSIRSQIVSYRFIVLER